jgi:hypothetical protein
MLTVLILDLRFPKLLHDCVASSSYNFILSESIYQTITLLTRAKTTANLLEEESILDYLGELIEGLERAGQASPRKAGNHINIMINFGDSEDGNCKYKLVVSNSLVLAPVMSVLQRPQRICLFSSSHLLSLNHVVSNLHIRSLILLALCCFQTSHS